MVNVGEMNEKNKKCQCLALSSEDLPINSPRDNLEFGETTPQPLDHFLGTSSSSRARVIHGRRSPLGENFRGTEFDDEASGCQSHKNLHWGDRDGLGHSHQARFEKSHGHRA